MWDGASCIPLTLAGDTAVLPCMDSFKGVKYSAFGKYACDSTRLFVCLFVLILVCSCCMRENNISSFGLKCTMKTYPTSVSVNASRYCEDDGTWSNQTNYLDCYCKGSLVHR